MTQYVGLDVSMEETKLHVLDGRASGYGVGDVRLNPLRSLRQFVGALRLRRASDLRLDN